MVNTFLWICLTLVAILGVVCIVLFIMDTYYHMKWINEVEAEQEKCKQKEEADENV